MQERKINDDIAILTLTREELVTLVNELVATALTNQDTLNRICDHCTARNATVSAIRAPYRPPNIEYKNKNAAGEIDNPDLPKWARDGAWS